MQNEIKGRITQKHDIEANWIKAGNAEKPFIPLAGETIYYDPDENCSSFRHKVGDGITNVNNLPFVGGADWNQNDESAADYIKNRTHYHQVEENVVSLELTDIVQSDYYPNGRYVGNHDCIGDNFHRFDRDAFTELVGKTITLTIGDKSYQGVVNDAGDSYEDWERLVIGDFWYLLDETNDNGTDWAACIIDDCQFGMLIPQEALADALDPSVKKTISFTETIETLKELDEKYIPDSIARANDVTSSIDSNINQLRKEISPNTIARKTDILSLRNQIDSISTVKDWNQSDENASDYIKNRTHYDSSVLQNIYSYDDFYCPDQGATGYHYQGKYVYNIITRVVDPPICPHGNDPVGTKYRLDIYNKSNLIFSDIIVKHVDWELKYGDDISYNSLIGNAVLLPNLIPYEEDLIDTGEYAELYIHENDSYIAFCLDSDMVNFSEDDRFDVSITKITDYFKQLDEKFIPETIARKSDVKDAVDSLVDTAPATLNTLNELSKALGDDPNFATTVLNEVGKKVNKVDGKGLSTNDFTTAEKNKLAGIGAGAEKNVQPDWERSDSTKDDFIKNKTHYKTVGSTVISSIVGTSDDWYGEVNDNNIYADIDWGSAGGNLCPAPITLARVGLDQALLNSDISSFNIESFGNSGNINRQVSNSYTLIYLSDDIDTEMRSEHAIKGDIAILASKECNITINFYIYNPASQQEGMVNIHIPSAGLWITHSTEINNVNFGTYEYHTIDEKYIPDTIARSAKLEETEEALNNNINTLSDQVNLSEDKIYNIINSLNKHKYDSTWYTAIAATPASRGKEYAVCSLCGHKIYRKTPKLEELPGLYNSNGFTSWEDLVSSGTITLTDNTIMNSDKDMAGKLIIPEGIFLGYGYIVNDDGYWTYDMGLSGCTLLESVVIPEGQEWIPGHAFSGCTSLATLYLPSTIFKYGFDDACFADCYLLKDVYLNGTISQWQEAHLEMHGMMGLPDSIDVTIHCTDGDFIEYGAEYSEEVM